MPALEELIANHNQLTILDRDFQGLPVLCWADLSNNQIVALGRDLVSKTHCKVHGIHEDTWGTLKIYLQGKTAVHIKLTTIANIWRNYRYVGRLFRKCQTELYR